MLSLSLFRYWRQSPDLPPFLASSQPPGRRQQLILKPFSMISLVFLWVQSSFFLWYLPFCMSSICSSNSFTRPLPPHISLKCPLPIMQKPITMAAHFRENHLLTECFDFPESCLLFLLCPNSLLSPARLAYVIGSLPHVSNLVISFCSSFFSRVLFPPFLLCANTRRPPPCPGLCCPTAYTLCIQILVVCTITLLQSHVHPTPFPLI